MITNCQILPGGIIAPAAGIFLLQDFFRFVHHRIATLKLTITGNLKNIQLKKQALLADPGALKIISAITVVLFTTGMHALVNQ